MVAQHYAESLHRLRRTTLNPKALAQSTGPRSGSTMHSDDMVWIGRDSMDGREGRRGGSGGQAREAATEAEGAR